MTIFENMPEGKIKELISSLQEKIRAGESLETATGKLRMKQWMKEELYSIARARIKGGEKFDCPQKMFMNMDDLRYATPDIVAEYRAGRIKCDHVVEIGCGIGGQTIHLAGHCKIVVAVDIDERRVAYANRNAKACGLKNVDFLVGDALDKKLEGKILEKIRNVDYIFCDPQRAPFAAERKPHETSPPITDLLLRFPKARGFAFEMPPQLHALDIVFNCEKEYISVNGKLNRLTLYFGELKKDEVSVVNLPSGEKLAGSSNTKTKLKKSRCLKYLHQADDAVVHAGLVHELTSSVKEPLFLLETGKHLLLTSKEAIHSVFLESYLVLKIVKNNKNSKENIKKSLKDAGAGKVVLRGRIAPEDYWNLRNEFEKGLSGKKIVHLFLMEDKTIICIKAE